MIVFHVLVAILTLGLSTYNFFEHKESILKVSYIGATITLASGVSLIFINNASVIRTCLSGIAFFAVVSVLNELTRKKLTPPRILIKK